MDSPDRPPAAPLQSWHSRPSCRSGTLRGAPGFFQVAQQTDGRWTLLDPAGRPFFAKMVHGARSLRDEADRVTVRDSAVRLREWGFNALGVGSEVGLRDDGLPFLGVVDFFGAGLVINAPRTRLPDVFDHDWPKIAEARAQAICTAASSERQLIGWVTDDRLSWAQPALSGRPTLLQVCLSLEPSFAAYHAAWEFALALHGGSLGALAEAWAMRLPNKEVVRELTRAEEGIGTRGYLRDEARWTREFGRRYFNVTAAAIRAADPNHLVLGSRAEGATSPTVLAASAYPAVDVALCDWRELPNWADDGATPVLASNVSWTSEEFVRLPSAARSLRLTSVEWMLRRGRLGLKRMAHHRAVVGYAWGAWQDGAGDQPPFGSGLIHLNGVEAREHTELLTSFNRRVDDLRRDPAPAPVTRFPV